MKNRAKFKILIVDDSTDMRLLLDTFISQRGFTVYHACDFDTAVDQISGGEVHLVVSDIQMPGRSGVDLLKAIRTTHAELPILLFSCSPEPYEREAIDSGAMRVLRKDCFTELLELIDRVYSDSFVLKANHAN